MRFISLIRNPIFTQHIILSLIEQELFPSGRLFILNGKPCRKYPGTGFHISIAMVYRNPNFFIIKSSLLFSLYFSCTQSFRTKQLFFKKNILSAAFCYRHMLSSYIIIFNIYLNMPLRHALLASFLPSAQTMHESLFTGYFLFQFVLKSS